MELSFGCSYKILISIQVRNVNIMYQGKEIFNELNEFGMKFGTISIIFTPFIVTEIRKGELQLAKNNDVIIHQRFRI